MHPYIYIYIYIYINVYIYLYISRLGLGQTRNKYLIYLSTHPTVPFSCAGTALGEGGGAEALKKTQLPPPLDENWLLHQLPPFDVVTPTNWPAVLANVGHMIPGVVQTAPNARAALAALRKDGYAKLRLGHRVDLLEGLMAACLETEVVRVALASNAEKRDERRLERA